MGCRPSGFKRRVEEVLGRSWVKLRGEDWINVRDPLYFLGYGIPYIYEKRILFSSWGNVG